MPLRCPDLPNLSGCRDPRWSLSPGRSVTVRVIIPQTGPPPVPTSRIPSSRPTGGAILSWSYSSPTTRTPVHTSPVMSVCPVCPSTAMSVCPVHPFSSVPPSQDPVPSSCPCPPVLLVRPSVQCIYLYHNCII